MLLKTTDAIKRAEANDILELADDYASDASSSAVGQHALRFAEAEAWQSEQDRPAYAHMCEEFNEVKTFTTRTNAIEETGDLLFTAIRYVNERLEARGDAPVTLTEVLALNFAKLSIPKQGLDANMLPSGAGLTAVRGGSRETMYHRKSNK